MKPKMRVLVDEKHHQPLSRGFSSNDCELREKLQDVVMLILFNVLLLSFFSSLKAWNMTRSARLSGRLHPHIGSSKQNHNF